MYPPPCPSPSDVTVSLLVDLGLEDLGAVLLGVPWTEDWMLGEQPAHGRRGRRAGHLPGLRVTSSSRLKSGAWAGSDSPC